MLGAKTPDELRISYQRFLAVITALDAAGEVGFVTVSQLLADIAMATLDAALQIARSREPDAQSVRFAIMAMGKTGGHELNYLSDVDVIFYDTFGQVQGDAVDLEDLVNGFGAKVVIFSWKERSGKLTRTCALRARTVR